MKAELARPSFQTLGVSRAIVEKYDGKLIKAQASDTGALLQQKLAELGFSRVPRSNWDWIGYEIGVIQLCMTGLEPESKGNRELRDQCLKMAKDADKLAEQLCGLTRWQTISLAFLYTGEDASTHASKFFDTARRLELTAAALEAFPQPRKWSASRLRTRRLALACKLAPLFEVEFELPAKPLGGSASRDDRHENEWVQFYQSAAAIILEENSTPDRQAILWEASQLSDI